jgi:uncharacterized protein YggE
MQSGKVFLNLIIILLLSAGTVRAEEKTVTVIGKANLIYKPDVAFVTLFVLADGVLMSDEAKKANEKLQEIKKAFQENIKDMRSLEVADIVVGEVERMNWMSERRDMAPRPQIAKRIRITMEPNVKKIYDLVDKAIRAGALMQIPSSSFSSHDSRTLVGYGWINSNLAEKQAREAAMNSAKLEAGKLAAFADKTIGKVVRIDIPSSEPCGD